MSSSSMIDARTRASDSYRWAQVILGMVCMLVPGTLLYGWTVFVGPIDAAYGWGRPAIQTAFTIFVVSEAGLMWLMGPVVDKYGPRNSMIVAGILVALGCYLYSVAATLTALYLAAVVAGVGSGIVTCATVTTTVKWFPHKNRGFAAGITVMGFALGALITILPMVDYIKSHGYKATFLWFGIAMGLLLVVCAIAMRFPLKGEVSGSERTAPSAASVPDYSPSVMVRTAPFWILFVMFTFIVSGAHLVTAHLAPLANDYKITNAEVSLFGGALVVTGLKLALFIDRVCNVLSRPIFGKLSDKIGREYAMAIAFSIEALALFAMYQSLHDPWLFAVFSGAAFLAFGEIYVLMPVIIAEIYGEKHAATNYSVLYIAKALAAVWVPIGSWLVQVAGGWGVVFYIAIVCDAIAALLALYLISVRRRMS